MTKQKTKFNYHEAEGRDDGKHLKSWKLASKFEILKNARKFYGNAPIMATYEENYRTYKEAFLKAYQQARQEESHDN